MQFLVPQFIDVEAKIIGPISARQFIILLITGGVDFLVFRLAPLTVGIIVIFILTSVAAAFAFGKVNTQPMHYFVLNLTQTLRRPRLRLWHRAEYTERKIEEEKGAAPIPYKPMVSQSRLAEMSLLVDTGGSYGVNTQRADAVQQTMQAQSKSAPAQIQRIQLKELNFDRIKDPKLYGEK